MLAVLLGFYTWFWVVQAIYAPFKAIIAPLLLRRQKEILDAAAIGASQKPVVLIVAAKGVSSSFNHFLELVTRQHYASYRILFVTESKEDAARAAMIDYLGLEADATSWKSDSAKGLQEVELIVAGLAEDEGQKVHNQLAAFQHLKEEDEIVAFADADIVGDKDWLERLVTPLNVNMSEFVTGYRWFIPLRLTLANIVATNVNRGIAMLAGPSWHTLLWGGSMAMTRQVFEELKIPEELRGCLNDDLQISHVADKAGKKLLFVRTLMAPSPVDYDWGSLFEFGRRQYFQVRTYVTKFWFVALFLTSAWIIGAVSCWYRLLVHGDLMMFIPISLVMGSLIINHIWEPAYLHELFSKEDVKKLRKASRVGLFTNTLGFAAHFAIVISVAFMKEMTWAGIRYHVDGPRTTKVLSRK